MAEDDNYSDLLMAIQQFDDGGGIKSKQNQKLESTAPDMNLSKDILKSKKACVASSIQSHTIEIAADDGSAETSKSPGNFTTIKKEQTDIKCSGLQDTVKSDEDQIQSRPVESLGDSLTSTASALVKGSALENDTIANQLKIKAEPLSDDYEASVSGSKQPGLCVISCVSSLSSNDPGSANMTPSPPQSPSQHMEHINIQPDQFSSPMLTPVTVKLEPLESLTFAGKADLHLSTVSAESIPSQVNTSSIPSYVDTSSIPSQPDTASIPSQVDTSSIPSQPDTWAQNLDAVIEAVASGKDSKAKPPGPSQSRTSGGKNPLKGPQCKRTLRQQASASITADFKSLVPLLERLSDSTIASYTNASPSSSSRVAKGKRQNVIKVDGVAIEIDCPGPSLPVEDIPSTASTPSNSSTKKGKALAKKRPSGRATKNVSAKSESQKSSVSSMSDQEPHPCLSVKNEISDIAVKLESSDSETTSLKEAVKKVKSEASERASIRDKRGGKGGSSEVAKENLSSLKGRSAVEKGKLEGGKSGNTRQSESKTRKAKSSAKVSGNIKDKANVDSDNNLAKQKEGSMEQERDSDHTPSDRVADTTSSLGNLKEPESTHENMEGKAGQKTLMEMNIDSYLTEANQNPSKKASKLNFTVPKLRENARLGKKDQEGDDGSSKQTRRVTKKKPTAIKSEPPDETIPSKARREARSSSCDTAASADDVSDKQKIPSFLEVDKSTKLWKCKDKLRQEGALMELCIQGFDRQDIGQIVQVAALFKADFEVHARWSPDENLSIFISCFELDIVKNLLLQMYALCLAKRSLTIGFKHVGVYPAIQITFRVNMPNGLSIFDDTMKDTDLSSHEVAYTGNLQRVPAMCYPYVLLGSQHCELHKVKTEESADRGELRFFFSSQDTLNSFLSFYTSIRINGRPTELVYQGTKRINAHIETEGIKCYRNPSGLVFSEAKELLLPEQDLPIHYGGIYFPRAVCKVSKFTPRQEQQTVKQDPSSKDSSQSVAKTGDMKEKENVKSSPPGPEECKLSENSAGDPHPVSQVDQSLPVASQGIPAAIMSQVPPSSVMSQGQPSVNQGPPVMSQGPSSMSQGPPVMSQGQPSMNQGLPMMSQGQPSMNQGLPMMSQAQPSMNQGLPMMSQGQPSMNQGLPMMSQGPPAMGQGPPNVSQVPPPVNQGSALGQGPPMMSQGPPVMGQGPPQMLNQPHQVMKGFPMIMNQFLQGAHPPMLNQGPPPMMNIGVPPPMMNQGPSQMMNPGLPMMGQGRPPQMMNQGQPPPGVGPWMNRGPPPPMMGQRPPFMNPGFNRMPLSVPPPGLHSTESGSKDLEQEAWEASVRSFTNSLRDGKPDKNSIEDMSRGYGNLPSKFVQGGPRDKLQDRQRSLTPMSFVSSPERNRDWSPQHSRSSCSPSSRRNRFRPQRDRYGSPRRSSASHSRHSCSPFPRSRSRSRSWSPSRHYSHTKRGPRNDLRYSPRRSPIPREIDLPRRARSPRKRSKSPKRRARSPRKRSRSPSGNRSRSPRNRSKSPPRKRLKSPTRKRSKSPSSKRSKSPPSHRSKSPTKEKLSSSRDRHKDSQHCKVKERLGQAFQMEKIVITLDNTENSNKVKLINEKEYNTTEQTSLSVKEGAKGEGKSLIKKKISSFSSTSLVKKKKKPLLKKTTGADPANKTKVAETSSCDLDKGTKISQPNNPLQEMAYLKSSKGESQVDWERSRDKEQAEEVTSLKKKKASDRESEQGMFKANDSESKSKVYKNDKVYEATFREGGEAAEVSKKAGVNEKILTENTLKSRWKPLHENLSMDRHFIVKSKTQATEKVTMTSTKTSQKSGPIQHKNEDRFKEIEYSNSKPHENISRDAEKDLVASSESRVKPVSNFQDFNQSTSKSRGDESYSSHSSGMRGLSSLDTSVPIDSRLLEMAAPSGDSHPITERLSKLAGTSNQSVVPEKQHLDKEPRRSASPEDGSPRDYLSSDAKRSKGSSLLRKTATVGRSVSPTSGLYDRFRNRSRSPDGLAVSQTVDSSGDRHDDFARGKESFKTTHPKQIRPDSSEKTSQVHALKQQVSPQSHSKFVSKEKVQAETHHPDKLHQARRSSSWKRDGSPTRSEANRHTRPGENMEDNRHQLERNTSTTRSPERSEADRHTRPRDKMEDNRRQLERNTSTTRSPERSEADRHSRPREKMEDNRRQLERNISTVRSFEPSSNSWKRVGSSERSETDRHASYRESKEDNRHQFERPARSPEPSSSSWKKIGFLERSEADRHASHRESKEDNRHLFERPPRSPEPSSSSWKTIGSLERSEADRHTRHRESKVDNRHQLERNTSSARSPEPSSFKQAGALTSSSKNKASDLQKDEEPAVVKPKTQLTSSFQQKIMDALARKLAMGESSAAKSSPVERHTSDRQTPKTPHLKDVEPLPRQTLKTPHLKDIPLPSRPTSKIPHVKDIDLPSGSTPKAAHSKELEPPSRQEVDKEASSSDSSEGISMETILALLSEKTKSMDEGQSVSKSKRHEGEGTLGRKTKSPDQHRASASTHSNSTQAKPKAPKKPAVPSANDDIIEMIRRLQKEVKPS